MNASSIFQYFRLIYSSKLSKDIVSNSIILLFAKGIGFIVPIYIARVIGITKETDVFFFIFAFLMFFINTIAVAIESVLIPYLVNKNSNERNLLINRIISKLFYFIPLSIIIAFILLKPYSVYLTNFDKEQIEILYKLFYSSIPLFFIIIFNNILSSNLASQNKITVTSIAEFIRTVIILFTLLILFGQLKIYVLPLAFILGELTKLLFMFLLNTKKLGYIFFLRYDVDEEYLLFIRKAAVQVFAIIIVGFNPVIDRTMATWLNVGDLSIIEYSEKIYLIPSIFFILGFSKVILPRWAANFVQNNMLQIRKDVKIIGIVLFLLSGLVVMVMIYFNSELLTLLFGNKFTPIVLNILSFSSIIYLIGIPFYVLFNIGFRLFLATRNNEILLRLSIYRLILNILMNIIFIYYFGVYGIAISTTINSVIIMFVTIYIIKKTFTFPQVSYNS